MIGWKKKKPTSVVSLDWGYQTLRFEYVRKSGNTCRSEGTGFVELPEDLFKENPETIGTKLRDALESAGIREKQCIGSLPIGWLFTSRTEIPELEGEDLEFFFETHAEREFPFPVDELSISRSVFTSPSHKPHALMGALPSARLDHLNRIMETARLKPLSWSVSCGGATFLKALPDANALCLIPTPSGFDLLAVCGNRLAMARSLNETDSAKQIAREIKISVGELSADLQGALKSCFYFQDTQKGDEFKEALQEVADRLDLKPTSLSNQNSNALDLASDFLLNRSNPFEFLPPKVSPFQEWSQRISTGRNKWIGGGATAAALIIGLLFFWQGQKLQGLDEEWKAMEVQVGELEELQNRIRLYRPWFDETIPTLKLIKHLTEAFPERGDVWVKDLDIREPSTVICSGYARSNQAWLDMRKKLQESPEVKDLRVDQVREDKQLSFSFRYRWEESNQ
ncbi:MAG: hypothetical protein O2964_09580 [Verrucomicrobia bacterium]|nr:hypothetical protein [Verrucomicrobiota bacterium]